MGIDSFFVLRLDCDTNWYKCADVYFIAWLDKTNENQKQLYQQE